MHLGARLVGNGSTSIFLEEQQVNKNRVNVASYDLGLVKEEKEPTIGK